MKSIEEYTPYYFDHAPFMSLNYRQFSRERTAIGFAKREMEIIESYSRYITFYPDVKCEPLESFYLYYRCCGALDEMLLEDFLKLGAKTATWVCWIVLITPYKYREYSELIEQNFSIFPEDALWLPRLASLSCKGTSDDHQLVRIGNRISHHILHMPKRIAPLRRTPSEPELRRLHDRNEMLRTIYKKDGADAARAYLQNNIEIWDLSYEEWLISQEIPTM